MFKRGQVVKNTATGEICRVFANQQHGDLTVAVLIGSDPEPWYIAPEFLTLRVWEQ